MNKAIKIMAGLAGFVAAGTASAAVDATAAAGTFTTDFATNAAIIGGALLGAAFVAIVWKWLKGMAFN
ncbi:hypothetical protein [Pseudoalteromonas sp.]|uniref:hypothetical protein n=1 Tax=Pseudoalteromonas sp. TaxID=53249 RepID=UPI0035633767